MAVAVESNEDVTAELGVAMAMARIELGLQRSVGAKAELLAEIGTTLIVNGILKLNDFSRKSYML